MVGLGGVLATLLSFLLAQAGRVGKLSKNCFVGPLGVFFWDPLVLFGSTIIEKCMQKVKRYVLEHFLLGLLGGIVDHFMGL